MLSRMSDGSDARTTEIELTAKLVVRAADCKKVVLVLSGRMETGSFS